MTQSSNSPSFYTHLDLVRTRTGAKLHKSRTNLFV